jgi:hypothetical protein
MEIQLIKNSGRDIEELVEDLAAWRIKVFRDFPTYTMAAWSMKPNTLQLM